MRARLLSCCVVALLLAAAVPAGAAAGRTLARDAASPARSDGWGETLAYMASPGRLGVLGARAKPLYAIDVGGSCATAPELVALGGGQALLRCKPDGELQRLDIAERTLHAIPGARAALEAAYARTLGSGAFTAIGAYGVGFVSSAYHEGASESALDWRSGALVPANETATTTLSLDTPDFDATLCPRFVRRQYPTDLLEPDPWDRVWASTKHVIVDVREVGLTEVDCLTGRSHLLWPSGRGLPLPTAIRYEGDLLSWVVPRTLDRTGLGVELHGYLPECGVALAWRLAPYTEAAHVHGGVVLSEAPRPDGPWTIRRLQLGGVCKRTLRAWNITVVDSEHAAYTSARTATLDMPEIGGIATSVVSTFPVRRIVRPRGPLRVEMSIPKVVRSMRWRLGGGAWHVAARDGRDWTLPLPPVAASQPLAIDVRFLPGGTAHYLLQVKPPRGG